MASSRLNFTFSGLDGPDLAHSLCGLLSYETRCGFVSQEVNDVAGKLGACVVSVQWLLFVTYCFRTGRNVGEI